jgi:hypothetical protein
MSNLSIVIPCAVLGSICAVMIVFIWWWFPRTWNKGDKQDMELMDQAAEAGGERGDGLTPLERRQLAGQRAREYLQAIEARNKARAEGREVDEPLPVYRPAGVAHGGNEPPVYVV